MNVFFQNPNSSQNDPTRAVASSMGATPPPEGCLSDCHLFRDGRVIRNEKSIQDAEKIIARDLYQLTAEERQDILHDVHGVADIITEEPEFVDRCRNEFEVELIKRLHKSQALAMAWNRSPYYIRSLYLLFLRCDEFRVKDAVQRMIKHFDLKMKLFGTDKLCRDITIQDLDKYDLECYKVGFFQILPVRDRAGRAILCKIWYHQHVRTRENVWRMLWYLKMTILRDEETQKKGVVVVIYNVCDHWIEKFDRELFMGVADIRAAVPIRVVAVHYCYSDPAFGAIISFFSLAMEMHTRTRTRLQGGSHLEVQYSLQTFGIPLSALPVTSDGTLRLKEHEATVKIRRSQESSCMTPIGCVANTIVVPSNNDVLFGRGKILQTHLGNMRFGNFLEEEMENYVKAKRLDKVVIVNSIIDKIKKAGGRFLRQDKDGVWLEVDAKTAADKVSHGFRNRKSFKPEIKKVTEKRPVAASSTHGDEETNLLPAQDGGVSEKRSKYSAEKEATSLPVGGNSLGIRVGVTFPPQRAQEYVAEKRSRFNEEAKTDNTRNESCPASLDEIPLDLEDISETLEDWSGSLQELAASLDPSTLE